MTEEELEVWFATDGGRGARIKHFKGYWEATVFDLEDTWVEGEGEGDTMLEALSDAVAGYQRCACGAF